MDAPEKVLNNESKIKSLYMLIHTASTRIFYTKYSQNVKIYDVC